MGTNRVTVRNGRGRTAGRRGPRPTLRALSLVACLAMLAGAGAWLESAAATRATRPAPSPLTRADLAVLRGRVALLESELALARSRKPYLVVDAGARRLRFALLGMTMRDFPAQEIDIDGLRRPGDGGVPGPLSLAGIVTLKEKEKDPRLSPLTPEQIEAGAADENVADALPPEAPVVYALSFKQPVAVRIDGSPAKTIALSRASSWWQRMWPGSQGGMAEASLRLTVRLDETTAREMYRALLPGERLLIVPPSGRLLPEAGQESPRSVRPGRPVKPSAPQPGPPVPGVPFRIPPPVAESPAGGTAPAGGGSAPGETGDPAVGAAPPAPADAAPAPTPPAPGAHSS
jgi:hypothetical protein